MLAKNYAKSMVMFHSVLRAGYRLTPMRPRSSSKGRNTSASVTVTVAVDSQENH